MMIEKNLNENLGYRQHPAIANSDLKYLDSPKLFKMNKERQLEQEDNEAYEKGNLIDDFLLSPDVFKENYHVVENEVNTPNSPNKEAFCNDVISGMDVNNAYLNNYKVSDKDIAAQAYVSKAEALYHELERYIAIKLISQYSTIVYPSDYAMLCNISLSVSNHILANKFINQPDKGWEVLNQLEITDVDFMGIKWKGKLDRCIIDHINQIIYNIDLKSTKGQSYFPYDYKRYKYYRQQALYEILLLSKFKHLIEKGYIIKTRVIAVEKEFPYQVRVLAVPGNILEKGREELVEAAGIIKWHQDNDLWEHPISYYQNQGLQIIDWKHFDE